MTSLDENELHELLFRPGTPSLIEENLAALLEESLSLGEPLFLEGIGVLAFDQDGRMRIEPSPKARVFLAYVVEDLAKVRAIFHFLKSRGFEPWMDVECLMPGQNWPRAIERAIDDTDFVVPCFSKVSTSKHGFFQAELRYALDCACLQPLDEPFLVPVRLEPCDLPKSIEKRTQYVDLFPDAAAGMRRLLRSLRAKRVTGKKE